MPGQSWDQTHAKAVKLLQEDARHSQETITAAHDDAFKVKAATPQNRLCIPTFALGTMINNYSVRMCTLDAVKSPRFSDQGDGSVGKELVTKPGNLGSVPGTHTVGDS